MKSLPTFFVRLATLTGLSVLLLTLSSAAATHPLNSPQGLALASNGNLCVANNGGNNILVYGPAHVQMSAKTITKNISGPTVVAFDLVGNLWVANGGSNSITAYSVMGVQNTAKTISSGNVSPNVIAFDALNDLWVNIGYLNLSIYRAESTTPIVSVSTTSPFTGLASFQSLAVIGTNSQSFSVEISPYQANQNNGVVGFVRDTCFAAAFDNTGNLFCAHQDHSLREYTSGARKVLVADRGFFPFGLAIDGKRGLIYVANGWEIAFPFTAPAALLSPRLSKHGRTV